MKNKFLRNTLILSAIALIALLLPALLIKVGVINPYVAQIITLAGVNAIMALSVNIICGITGQLSLGQAGFMALGAYATIIFSGNLHVPLPIAIIIAGCITAIFGFLIGFPTLKLDGDYLAIVTLAFGEIIRVVLVNLGSIAGSMRESLSANRATLTAQEIASKQKLIDLFSIFGPNGKSFDSPLVFNPTLAFIVVAGVLILTIVLLQNFIRSTYGRAILAVREDEIAANSSGIAVFRYKMIGFVIASFVAGIGGSLYVSLIGFVKPDQASFNKSIDYLIYVVLGGMGSVTGSVLAAFVLTSLQEVLRFLQNFRLLIYPVILIIVMLFRPQGLLGYKELSFIKVCERIYKKIKSPGKNSKASAEKSEGGSK
ncbi:MAG: branched-chain amino acid ABC transporter permease [Treponema sp.]|nr:branched-chain amino acid ABC transporter permease [Treponema sp.]